MTEKTKEWLDAKLMIFSTNSGNKSKASILPAVPLQLSYVTLKSMFSEVTTGRNVLAQSKSTPLRITNGQFFRRNCFSLFQMLQQ